VLVNIPCAKQGLLLVLGVLLYIFFDTFWVFVYMLYGFLARVTCGPRLDPQVRSDSSS
jgi:hypothetical protein